LAIFATGCGLKGKELLDPPKEVTNIKEEFENDLLSEEEEESVQTMMTELYLFDSNGLVVSQTLPLPASEGAAKQALMHLVEDGPVTELLPNGFKAVLPAGTMVDLDIQDGVAIVDFSEEFKQYAKEDE